MREENLEFFSYLEPKESSKENLNFSLVIFFYYVWMLKKILRIKININYKQ